MYDEAARLRPGEYFMNISGSYNGELFEARFTRYIIPGFPPSKTNELEDATVLPVHSQQQQAVS